MKKKIVLKFFLMFNLIVTSIFILLFISNNFLLEKYYLRYKENQMLNIANDILENGRLDLDEIGEKNNLKIQILSIQRYQNFINRMDRPPAGANMRKPMRARDDEGRSELTLIDGKPSTKVMVHNIGDGAKFMVLSQKINDRDILLIHSPIFAINEAVMISIRFLIITFIFGLLLSVILSISLSFKISKPIKEMEEKTKDMANLNFDNKLEIKRDDELGSLAKSINLLSSNLKHTIDDLEVSNDRLKLEIEKEKEIDKLRREFIDNANHELKTPIAIIEGYAEGLLDNINSEEDKEFYCSVIIDECKKMNNLVKKLLLKSKYENNFVELNIENFDITEIIDELLKKYSLDLANKGLKIIKEYTSEIRIDADKSEIATAIDNYLSNAINYSKDAEPIIIKVEELGEDIYFSISNSCDYIDNLEIERLFEPFSKIDKSRNRKYGGTGLGLSIVKRIIELHKGLYGANYKDGRINFFIKIKR